MAQKTSLSSNEVTNLLMESPVSVCEWMQHGMLHASVSGAVMRPFTMGDVAQFAKDKGLQFNRPGPEKLRILIVNDDVHSARRLVEILDTVSDSADAIAVHNAFDAGRKIPDFNPDMVLLDSRMPLEDRLEICRQIKSDHATRHVKIMAVIDSKNREQRQRMLMAGVDVCLDRPISNQELLDVMGFCRDSTDEMKNNRQ